MVASQVPDPGGGPLPPPPAGTPSRSGRGWLIGGIAIASIGVLLVVGGLVLARDGDGGPDAYCTQLAAPMPERTSYRSYDVIIWFQPSAAADAIDAVRARVDDDDRVRAPGDFVDQDAAYDEFAEQFADSPEMTGSVTPDVLPASLRLHLDDPAAAHAVAGDYDSDPAVRVVKVPADDPVPLLADELLGVFLGAEPGADDVTLDATFDDDAVEALDRLDDVAPEEIVDDLEVITDAVRTEVTDVDPSPAEPIEVTERQRDAAARVVADAADRCGWGQSPEGAVTS